MLRKLLADHQPEYIAASFDLPARPSAAELAADYKANRTAMPDDLERADALGARGVRGDGRAHLHRRRLRGRRRDRDAGGKAAAAGFQVAIVTGDKDFFQLVGDGIRVYNPRDEGAGTTRPACGEIRRARRIRSWTCWR